MLSVLDVLSKPLKTITHKAREIWIEVYILWFSMIGQIIGVATPYWSLIDTGYSGLWESCVWKTDIDGIKTAECLGVFELGDPQHWLRCVQIVVCISLPLTILSAMFMILASTKTNTGCATPAGFASLTSGCMLLLGCGFYGYQQSEAARVGWSLLTSLVSGCLCVFCCIRMCINCVKPRDESIRVEIYQQGPIDL